MAKTKIKIGDWVRIQQSGIWRVVRIQPVLRCDPVSGKPENQTLVFVHRIANDSFKKSFSASVVDATLVRPLSKARILKIEKDSNLLEQFELYRPDPIDAIFNLACEKPAKLSKSALAKKFKQKGPMTEFGIIEFCQTLALELGYHEWSIQLVSHDHRVDDSNRLLYSFKQILT